MSGHSKWANIKHRKAEQDSKRGKVFTKIIHELMVAARAGGPSPDDNPSLRSAVDKALGCNMTRDTINRAITRGAGTGDGADMDEITYEGYGPGGIAVLVECLTDNKNRTVAEVRHAFSKHGGNMGTSGSVAYLFEKKGQMYFEPGADEDAIMEAALESGADDVVTNDDGSIEVMTDWTELTAVKESLESAGQKPAEAEVAMIPATRTELNKEGAEKILRLIDRLESLDDVQDVYTNADISDDIMDQIQDM